MLAKTKPDLIVGVANDHLDNFFFDNLPTFAVANGPIAEGHFWYENDVMNLPRYRAKVHQGLAQYLLRHGVEEGIQFSQVHDFKIDHAFTVPLSFVRPEEDLPMVAIMTNAFGYPIPPNRKWYELGQFLRRAIESWPGTERVAVVGSFNLTVEVGGPNMGHYNFDLQRWILEQMRPRQSRRDPDDVDGAAPHRRGQLDRRVPELRHGAGRGREQAAFLHPAQAGQGRRDLSSRLLGHGVRGLGVTRLTRTFAWACFAAAAFAAGVPARADTFKLIVTETETPLVPNSVADLAIRLGYYKKAGVDVELVRVQQTPSAVAALRSGEGDLANLAIDTALQHVGRDQMKLRGVISPDKALPILNAAKKSIAMPADLEGKVFGVARIGSADYTLSRAAVVKLGVSVDKLQYLSIGQPPVRAQSLLAGQIDATAISIGVWTTLPDKSALSVLIDQQNFYRLAPFVSKLNVVTEDVAKAKAKEIRAVIRGIIMASRDFAKDPKLWVDAMVQARPDVKREDLEALGESYRMSWSVNGGLNLKEIKFTTDTEYASPDFKDLRRVEPSEWIDTSFVDAVLKELNIDRAFDVTGRR